MTRRAGAARALRGRPARVAAATAAGLRRSLRGARCAPAPASCRSVRPRSGVARDPARDESRDARPRYRALSCTDTLVVTRRRRSGRRRNCLLRVRQVAADAVHGARVVVVNRLRADQSHPPQTDPDPFENLGRRSESPTARPRQRRSRRRRGRRRAPGRADGVLPYCRSDAGSQS